VIGRTCCGLLLFGAISVAAQEYSYDGNRWYDVEVSIFTNEVPGGATSEIPVARKLTAAYLPRLRELQTRSSVFMIEFPQDQPPVVAAAPVIAPALLPSEPLAEPTIMMGPIYSPAVRDGFKITDFERDPFIDLGTRAAQFTAMNRSIDSAPEHRLLWHKAWRQPMEGRAQTAAIFVGGGDLQASHNELEGSLRLSDNAGGVMLDINIWLNRFGAALAPGSNAAGEEWKIPEVPFPTEMPFSSVVTELAPAQQQLIEVWQLEQTRELGAGQLYYLDHPALGVLIQVRPYLLPPRLVAEDQEDF
jgi:hypothetical protein